jgi:hypothetical protein
VRNLEAKRLRAAQRQRELVELGKTLIETEVDGPEVDGKPTKVKKYELPVERVIPTINISAHAFVGEKMRRTHSLSMRNRPGNKELHAEAIVEDASRTFTKECDKAMSVPAVEAHKALDEIDALLG